MPSKAQLEFILNKAEDLPEFPLTTMKVYNLCSDPETSPEDLEKFIKTDPALVAKLLRIVNSSLYGYSNINSIHQVVNIMGFNGIKQLCILGSINEIFAGKEGKKLWIQSLGACIAAKEIFNFHKKELSESQFLSCLLHNIGRSLLLKHFNKDYKDFLEYDDYDYLLEKEKKVFGIDHKEIGAKLVERWAFPKEVVEGIKGVEQETVGDEHLLGTAILLAYFNEEDLQFESRVSSSYKNLKNSITEKTQEQISAIEM